MKLCLECFCGLVQREDVGHYALGLNLLTFPLLRCFIAEGKLPLK
jgi:hypothetical protein